MLLLALHLPAAVAAEVLIMEVLLTLEEMAAQVLTGIQLTDLGAAEAAVVCITLAVMADYMEAVVDVPVIVWELKREAMEQMAS
jgi:hypothetical protein